MTIIELIEKDRTKLELAVAGKFGYTGIEPDGSVLLRVDTGVTWRVSLMSNVEGGYEIISLPKERQ